MQIENQQQKYNILRRRGCFLQRLFWQKHTKEDHMFFIELEQIDKKKQLKEYVTTKKIISGQSFYCLLIESTYLIFTADSCKIGIKMDSIYLDERDLKKNGKIKLYMKYFIHEYNQVTSKILNHQDNLLKKFIDIVQKIMGYEKEYAKQTQIQLHTFFDVFVNLIRYKFKNQKQIFYCVEQSELFRKRALFTKLKNCMIMNKVLEKQGVISRIKQVVTKQIEITKNYQKMLKLFNLTGVKSIQKQFKQIMQNFWVEDLLNIIKIDKEKIEKDKQLQKQPSDDLQENKPKIQAIKINFTLYQKEFMYSQEIRKYIGKSIQKKEKKIDFKRSVMKYELELSLQKGLVLVTLRSDYQVNVQTLDKVLYLCTQIIFEAMTVEVQPEQKKSTLNSQDKTFLLLTAKVENARSGLLYHALVLIDTLIVVFKILQEHLVNQNVDVDELIEMMNHYIGIVQRCSNQLYR